MALPLVDLLMNWLVLCCLQYIPPPVVGKLLNWLKTSSLTLLIQGLVIPVSFSHQPLYQGACCGINFKVMSYTFRTCPFRIFTVAIYAKALSLLLTLLIWMSFAFFGLLKLQDCKLNAAWWNLCLLFLKNTWTNSICSFEILVSQCPCTTHSWLTLSLQMGVFMNVSVSLH